MEQLGYEVERFDELFEKMSAVAKRETGGISDIDEKSPKKRKKRRKKKIIEHGTWYIKEPNPRRRIVRFMIFSSELKTEEPREKGSDKHLYGPSITAFEGKRKLTPLHVKKRDLEIQPDGSKQTQERKDKLVTALGRIEELFSDFEKPAQ